MAAKTIKWLTTLDLENYIEKFSDDKTRDSFLGVFPINRLPQRLPYLPALLIVNTDTSNLPGQHWKAIYISKKREGEVFDSLATPVGLILQHWMNLFTRKWTASTLTLQNPLSPSCGAYVLYFVMNRLKHSSLKSCITKFSSNVFENEIFIEEFYKKQLK
jgi:hypothetical protein